MAVRPDAGLQLPGPYALITLMAYTKSKVRPQRSTTTQRPRRTTAELDSVYVLKIVMYLVLGTLWVRFTNAAGTVQLPLPIGLVVGVIFALHDHFSIDRKIEYAVLLVAMLVGFWSQIGLRVIF